MDAPPSTRFLVTTAPTPGAIAIIQLHGPSARRIASALTGAAIDTDRSRLVDFAGIDEGLVVSLRDDWVQLMPHGGVRVVQAICERLRELGAIDAAIGELAARDVYPEASSDLEADMLATLARATSPAAIDLLLAQPRTWRSLVDAPGADASRRSAILSRSDALDRLVDPPTVALVGRANVGKSTLTNLVMGRAASITADLPGTTRDWVSGLAELPTPIGEVAVRWFDTPGLRDSDDPIEQRAIALARRVAAEADVLVEVTDPDTPPPDRATLPRAPDLRVLNKCDLVEGAAGNTDTDVLRVSALHDRGLDRLAAAIVAHLGIAPNHDDALWAFTPRLRALLESGDVEALRDYVG